MRKINENDFVDYTISGNGWNCTFPTLTKAMGQWKDITAGTLYGNKPDGSRAILDTKQ